MLNLPNVLLLSSGNPNPNPNPPASQRQSAPGYTYRSLEEGPGKVCRDCGNRAKRECRYGRCRTCCKSRGYRCPSHVKSTWVPASDRKKEKSSCASGGSSSSGGGKTAVPPLTRRLYGPSPMTASLAPASAPQDASFKESLPAKVRSSAVFRRIMATAVTDGEMEIAYQATATIKGHIFKGFLYNHGVDEKNLFPLHNAQLHSDISNGATNRNC